MLCATKGVMIHDANPPVSNTAHFHHSNPHAHHQMGEHSNHKMSQSTNHHAHHMSLVDSEPQAQTNAEDHEAEGCPCIHFFFDTKFHLEPNSALVKASQPIIDSIQASPTSTVYAAKARGPPVVRFIHNPFTTFT
ncbi:hypothetical protein MUS1_03935 [Marinomonas ushuaiensis DSM 15871]|uniref:Uncharacterized protein n=2 Tax=Marinomonas TaxID=28253 RepID=X7E4X5_9GAMM|nr:hypothetical protein MUS1_03935 [Marinomonas ushuaiensis DSM 15871]